MGSRESSAALPMRNLLSVLVLLGLISLRVHASEEAPRPNIIFVLVDDLGFGDVGVFFQNARAGLKDRSKPVHFTPGLDRLAKEGAQMPHYYCPAPVCAPSRATLLLGVHQGHANVRDNQFDKALEDNHTLASVLKKGGYATAAIGKWGLQGKPENGNFPGHPLNRGFDFYYGYLAHKAGHFHYPKEDKQELFEGRANVSAGLDLCYTADLFTARAKHWIETHRSTRPNDPFFLYLAYDTPHAKLQLPPCPYPAGGGLFGGVRWEGTPGRMINTATGEPDSFFHPDYETATWDHDKNPATPEVPWPDVFKRFATDVRRIDDCISDLVQELKDLQIDENTLIVFTSDNGPSIESYLPEKYEPTFFQSFGPFDGIKRDCWEGGIRVGALARWPKGIGGNRVVNLPCSATDWMATFAELAGVPPPARTDGVSLVPALSGKGHQKKPSVYVEYAVNTKTPEFAQFEPQRRGRSRKQMQVLRSGDFVGVRYNVESHATDFEIYDVVRDPKQTENLAASKPSLQAELKNAVLRMRRPDVDAPRPYDRELVPAVQIEGLKSGVEWAAQNGHFSWVSELAAESETGVAVGLAEALHAKEGMVAVSGYLRAPQDGEYAFHLKAGVGSVLRLHEALVVDADFNFEVGFERSGTILLKAGLHPFRLLVRTGEARLGGAVTGMEWSGPGFERGAVPEDALFRKVR